MNLDKLSKGMFILESLQKVNLIKHCRLVFAVKKASWSKPVMKKTPVIKHKRNLLMQRNKLLSISSKINTLKDNTVFLLK